MRFYKTEDNLYRIKNIIKNDKVQQFDIVNCQFALHYFFKSEKTLANFISNVHENLKSNGLLVTTFIDANSLLAKATKNKYKSKIVDVKIGKINEKITGNKVTVALKGTKYFGKNGNSKEFLVKSEDFIERMIREGFKVVDNIQFSNFFGKTEFGNLLAKHVASLLFSITMYPHGIVTRTTYALVRGDHNKHTFFDVSR